MTCDCGSPFRVDTIEEWEGSGAFVRYCCPACGFGLGIETEVQEASSLFDCLQWTDEAQHLLDRLPPYVEPLVREEVEDYARQKNIKLVTGAFLTEVRNHGTVSWNAEAEARLSRVPTSVRAMARVELERTALERGMPEVTEALMEEIKSRYFGMAAQ